MLPVVRYCLYLLRPTIRHFLQDSRCVYSYLRAYKAPHAGLSLACPELAPGVSLLALEFTLDVS